MRYLRMLTNALAGGVLIALYLGILVLQLNPQVQIISRPPSAGSAHCWRCTARTSPC
jgi:hypothetical protein